MKNKKIKPYKRMVTAYVEESVLLKWRTLVQEKGMFYSSAMEESLKIWIEKNTKQEERK